MTAFNDKINFLAHIRRDSPLFLRLADDLLRKNEIHNAVIVLKKGLKKFPDHPVAYILLGKAFFLNGNYELADSNFKHASNLIGSKKTYTFYENEIKNAGRFKINRENFSRAEDKDQVLTAGHGVEKRKDQVAETKAIEDRLEQLAQAISSARIDRVRENNLQNNDSWYRIPERSKIVSETLAKIYLSQGERSEAIKVYERLIKRNPDRESYYLERIREIRST